MQFSIINVFLTVAILVSPGCTKVEKLQERQILSSKLEAFQFLSNYHDQLHIMIGEEKGDKGRAYDEFRIALLNYENNELIPVKNAFYKIDPNDFSPDHESVKRLDYLVDYYQSGLSLQIEAIMRGHGYLEVLEMNSTLELYDQIKK